MYLFTTNAGKIYIANPQDSSYTNLDTPDGVEQAVPFQRPDWTLYPAKKALVLVGQFEQPIVWYSDLRRAYTVGIQGPGSDSAPLISPTVGTGITANSVVYSFSYAHVDSRGRVRGESGRSELSTSLSVNNKAISVFDMPTSHPSDRVNFKRIWRRDNGGLTRHVANVAIGTSSYVDSTATLALGEPVPENRDLLLEYCKYTATYHDRVWYSGFRENRDRVYFSELGEVEAVGALSYIATRDGEHVTGIERCGDELIVFCGTALYSIQGYTSADFRMRKIDPSVGCISFASIVNINETLWFASETGVWTYNGQLKFQMEDLETYWRSGYEADEANYQDCVAIDDRFYQTYSLLIPKSAAFYYTGHYRPTWRGEQPYWVIDIRARKDSTIGVLSPPGSFRHLPYSGSCDGHARKMNVLDDVSDDSDSGAKTIKIETGAILFSDPGGSSQDGKTPQKLWSYVRSEESDWTFYALGGDEDVVNAGVPDNSVSFWKDSRSASFSTGRTAQSVHYHKPERVSGRALQVRIAAISPIQFRYRGFGGMYGAGPATRPGTT